MMNCTQLRELIIKPALYDLMLLSDDAVELMVFTCAVESLGGTYLKQVNGPALGIYQMEPATYNDIWQNYILKKTSLNLIMISNFDCVRMPSEERLIYDLRFATAMTRLFYARIPEKLPVKPGSHGLWDYYKKYYNTGQGSATQYVSIEKYSSFIKS